MPFVGEPERYGNDTEPAPATVLVTLVAQDVEHRVERQLDALDRLGQVRVLVTKPDCGLGHRVVPISSRIALHNSASSTSVEADVADVALVPAHLQKVVAQGAGVLRARAQVADVRCAVDGLARRVEYEDLPFGGDATDVVPVVTLNP